MLIALVPVLLALQAARPAGDSNARVRESALARASRAQAVARDADVRRAVLESNTRAESLAAVQRIDNLWTTHRNFPLRQQLVGRPCSIKLRKLLADDPNVVEALVMDDRGALVCASVEASDYWQGDEAKWQRTFRDGQEVFLDQPALDTSTGVYAVQLSVPISEGAKRVGALTLTLKIRRNELAP
jgi:hypothetical protein